MSPGTEVSNDARLRLAFLLLILASLAIYAVLQRPWESDGEEVVAAASPSACPAGTSPTPKTISLSRLARLRSEISSPAVFGANLDSYEEGFVGTAAAFSDAEPTMQPMGTAEEGVPAAYEYRWWTPNGADVGADVWVFDDPESAGEFLTQAASPRCRQDASAAAARFPAGGRNLEWRNPFGLMQQDLFFARGPRVYRLAVVAPTAKEKSVVLRREGFNLVNALGDHLLRSKSGATESAALS